MLNETPVLILRNIGDIARKFETYIYLFLTKTCCSNNPIDIGCFKKGNSSFINSICKTFTVGSPSIRHIGSPSKPTKTDHLNDFQRKMYNVFENIDFVVCNLNKKFRPNRINVC